MSFKPSPLNQFKAPKGLAVAIEQTNDGSFGTALGDIVAVGKTVPPS
jgi:hypothetical protein